MAAGKQNASLSTFVLRTVLSWFVCVAKNVCSHFDSLPQQQRYMCVLACVFWTFVLMRELIHVLLIICDYQLHQSYNAYIKPACVCVCVCVCVHVCACACVCVCVCVCVWNIMWVYLIIKSSTIKLIAQQSRTPGLPSVLHPHTPTHTRSVGRQTLDYFS